jgi:DnaJ-domain-containing protein 1
MSIGKRLFNLARAELNSLLDRAGETGPSREPPGDPDEDLYRRYSLNDLTDEELEAEIDRRYRARKEAERRTTADDQAKTDAAKPKPSSRPSGGPSGGASSGPAHRRSFSQDDLRRAYATLEVPFGSDSATVRQAYRTLMRKYHPDRQAGSPDKVKAATEVAQRLTQAYALIEHRSRS